MLKRLRPIFAPAMGFEEAQKILKKRARKLRAAERKRHKELDLRCYMPWKSELAEQIRAHAMGVQWEMVEGVTDMSSLRKEAAA